MAHKNDTELTKIESELTKIEPELTKTSIEISAKPPAGIGDAPKIVAATLQAGCHLVLPLARQETLRHRRTRG